MKSLFPISAAKDPKLYDDFADSCFQWCRQHLEAESAKRDLEASFDSDLYQKMLAELGLSGITLPEQLLGSNADLAFTLIALENIAYFDPGFALSYLAHELLFCHHLHQAWQSSGKPLPQSHAQILQKRPLAALAMTEAHAGTDVLAMQSWAKAQDNGHFSLQGSKAWITNAPLAEAFLIYARTGPERRQISLFLVPASKQGLAVAKPEAKMGMKSSPTASLSFNNSTLDPDALVGELHAGLSYMLENLAIERLGLATIAIGIAKRSFDEMRCYAKQRQAFGQNLTHFGQIQAFLAKAYADIQAADALIDKSLSLHIAKHPKAGLDADASKLFCTRASEELCRNAIQVLGANGYSQAYPVERFYRDAILLSIGGGTNEALQKNIARQLEKQR